MVTAIPTFHANLRRLHTAGESGTSRARALLLARACLDPEFGSEVFLAAIGDHAWRKLHGESEDPGAGRTPPWREGPQVSVPSGLRTHGKAGVRGRAPAPLDDSAARRSVALARAERLARHRASCYNYCRVSNSVSTCEALNCTNARCLTSCPHRFVSLACPLFLNSRPSGFSSLLLVWRVQATPEGITSL